MLVVLGGVEHLRIVVLMVLLCNLNEHISAMTGPHGCSCSFPLLIRRFLIILLLSYLLVGACHDRRPWDHTWEDLSWLAQVLGELTLAETMGVDRPLA